MRSFIFFTHPQILLGRSNEGKLGGRNVYHAWKKGGNFKGFWWESAKERGHSEDRGVDGRMGSELVLVGMAGEYKIGPFGSGWGPMAGLCKYGDGPGGIWRHGVSFS
jgi:hypothetical protein